MAHFKMADKYYIRDINSLRGADEHFNIAQTHIYGYLYFQYCLDETISQYKGAPACFMVNCELTL